MATSQQWRHAGLLLGAALVVLFIGSADAWNQCPPGYKDCDAYKPGCETCIKNDVNNCGDCNKKCKTLPYTDVKCNYGHCEYTCQPGWANCDQNIYSNGCEKDVRNDPKNCGSCGYCCKQVPHAVTKCSGGHCQEPVCNPGWANCDYNMWSNGCEKDVSNDIYNCGDCHHKCPMTLKGGEATCSNGVCGQQCKQGTKYDNNKRCCVQAY